MHPGVHAVQGPGRPAVVMGATGDTISYRRLEDESNQIAQLLRSRGLGIGSAVALCMENDARYHSVLWGMQRAGLYFTAVSSRLTAGEATYILRDCEARAYFASEGTRDLSIELAAALPDVTSRIMVRGSAPGYETWDSAVAPQPTTPIEDEWEGAAMLYSSGTTGRPKGVRHPLPGLGFGARPSRIQERATTYYGFRPDMVYLSPAPLYHAAPLYYSMAVHRLGGTVVVMEHFDPIDFLTLVERYGVTHTQMVPTMFVRLLKLPAADRRRFDLSSLEVAIHAAAPCPVEVKQQMIDWWGPILHEYYAGTEANGFCSIDSHEWLEHRGSVGRAKNVTIHVCADDGTELGPGEQGLVYFEGATNFEYHNDPAKTAAARHPEHPAWSTLGDIGYVEEGGWLHLTDRQSNMIIAGGVNIYPQEVEDVLVLHPEVADVAVIGVPHPDFGEEVKAVVQLVDQTTAGPALEQALIDHCRASLASFKCPRSVDFEPELPRHATGKLYKRLLKDRYWRDRAI